MPELPEVEATRRRLAAVLPGKRIEAAHVRRAAAVTPQRPSRLVKLAAGRRITTVRRRGKNLLIDLDGGLTLRVHLRMTGGLRVSADGELPPSARVWFELAPAGRLIFDDPRALGRVTIHTAPEAERLMRRIGPEPLERAFTAEVLARAAARSRQPAKLFLMDQRRVAGLGNIYAAEALHHAGIDPRTPVNRVPPEKLERLWRAIRSVLRQATKSATIAYNRPGRFHEAGEFVPAVYGREGEPCRTCGEPIFRIPQGGRSTYYCPHCQR